MPSRVELRASLKREGEVLDEQRLTVDIPRGAIGYVVDDIGFDLPSDLGLEAVDKFAMANLDTVRSKTGFMVGLVKLFPLQMSVA